MDLVGTGKADTRYLEFTQDCKAEDDPDPRPAVADSVVAAPIEDSGRKGIIGKQSSCATPKKKKWKQEGRR